jgi:16S rRNA (uracil1498-N3)-methyltransferase
VRITHHASRITHHASRITHHASRSMHRFYIPPEQCGGLVLVLTGREAHHALHVLRVRAGERVTVLNGAGGEFLCDVSNCTRSEVQLAVVEKKLVRPLAHQITLAQALPKGKTIESIIQKATELGVFRIVPLLSERVVTHVDEDGAAQKADKWQTPAVEAIKQCGSAWLPRIEAPITPAQFLARNEPFDLALVGSLQTERRHPRDYFSAYRALHGALPNSVCVWIGPEGDFSPDEMRAIESAGVKPITLGPLVLRSDTAAIYCISIVNYELQAPAE